MRIPVLRNVALPRAVFNALSEVLLFERFEPLLKLFAEDIETTACECMAKNGWTKPSCFEVRVQASKISEGESTTRNWGEGSG